MTLGETIKEIRKLKKIYQKDLAKMSGVSATYINQIEKGVYENPSLDVLNKIADALEVSVNELTKGLNKSQKEEILKNKVEEENREFLDKISKLSEEDKKYIRDLIERFEKK